MDDDPASSTGFAVRRENDVVPANSAFDGGDLHNGY